MEMGMSDRHYDGGSTHVGEVEMKCPDDQCDRRWLARAHIIAAGGCEVFESDESCPECGRTGDPE